MANNDLSTNSHLDNIPNDFSQDQLDAYSIATRCSAGISLACSMYLVVATFRNRSHIYHRLMLGLALHLVAANTWHVYGATAIPSTAAGAPKSAAGTTQTCTAQGFGLQLSLMAASFYYVSLSIYSFFAVRHNFQVQKYLWTEKWIHLAVHVFPVASAAWLLQLQAFNFAGNGVVCWIDSIPHACGDGTEVVCTRGPQNITQVAALCAALPTFFFLIFPTGVMCTLYCYVRRHQSSISRIEARTVAKQAFLYLCALYWAYLWTMINSGIRLVADRHIYGLAVLATFNLNLLGAYILLIYFYFGRNKKGPSVDNRYCVDNDNDQQKNININNNGSAPERRPKEDKDDGVTFNIFDGSNPTGKYSDFIYEGDSDDMEMDRAESARWADIQEYL